MPECDKWASKPVIVLAHTSSLKPHFNSRIPHFERLGTGTITNYLILTNYPESFFHSCPYIFTSSKSIPTTARLLSEPSVVPSQEQYVHPSNWTNVQSVNDYGFTLTFLVEQCWHRHAEVMVQCLV